MDITGDDYRELLQPHLDAISLFTQQAGTETSVSEGDYWMLMDHITALRDIAGRTSDGPERQAVLSLLEDFVALSHSVGFNVHE